MRDKEEIILMTKLALHERKYGKEDSKRNSYFQWDYIYIKNWYTRLAVLVAGMMIVSWMIFKDVYIKEIIPIIDIDLDLYLYKYGLFIFLMIVFYTGISTYIYNKKYKQTQARLDKYQSMLKELDMYQSKKEELKGGDFSDTD